MADGDSDYESWETAASSALKGKGLEDLTTKTFDDIERFPLYTRERNKSSRSEHGLPGESSFARGSRASGNLLGWEVRQTHFATRTGVNDHILTDLEHGATAITLKGAPDSAEKLRPILQGVYLDLAPIHLSSGSSTVQADALLEVCDDSESKSESLRSNLGLDPIGRLARTGQSVLPLDQEINQCAEMAAAVSTTFPRVGPISVD